MKPRYLHQDVARGYTHTLGSAASGEPEALSEFEQARLSRGRRAEWEAENAEKLARRQAAAWLRRLAQAEQTAIEHGFDVSSFQARIRGEIGNMEREVATRVRKARKAQRAA